MSNLKEKKYWRLYDLGYALAASSLCLIWMNDMKKALVTEPGAFYPAIFTMFSVFLAVSGIVILLVPSLFQHFNRGEYGYFVYVRKVLSHLLWISFWGLIITLGRVWAPSTEQWIKISDGFVAWWLYFFLMWTMFSAFRAINVMDLVISNAMSEMLEKKILKEKEHKQQ